MPPRKQKKNMKKLADVLKALKQCSVSSLSDEKAAPAQPEQPPGMLLDNNQNETQDKHRIDSDVPPIFWHQPVDFKEHVQKLLLSGVKFYQPHLGRNYTKVKCLSFEDHRGMIKYLKSNKLPYHTYGNPDHRKMKVVIRGLDKNTSLNALKDEIEAIKINVVRLHKMHTKQTAKEHPLLVLVIVASSEEGEKLMQVETLLGKTVKMEHPVVKARQCHRCQKWGHSQRYCHGKVKCVKCAGEHPSSKCTRDRNSEAPKCANCGGVHTASYKKCAYCPDSDNYKSTQNLKVKSIKNNTKPKLVTLLNYEDHLYRNVISFPPIDETPSDLELDRFEEVY